MLRATLERSRGLSFGVCQEAPEAQPSQTFLHFADADAGGMVPLGCCHAQLQVCLLLVSSCNRGEQDISSVLGVKHNLLNTSRSQAPSVSGVRGDWLLGNAPGKNRPHAVLSHAESLQR